MRSKKTKLLSKTFLAISFILGSFLLVNIALSAPSGGRGGKTTLPLKLTATSSKAQYAKGEPVDFTLKLENVSKDPVTVFLTLAGIVHLESFTVNGVAATKRTVVTSDVLPEIAHWGNYATTLQPGEAVQLSDGLDPIDGEAMVYSDVVATPGSGKGKKFKPGRIDTFEYVPPGYGTYRLKVFYEYLGPEFPNLPPAARGKIVSNEIVFAVQ